MNKTFAALALAGLFALPAVSHADDSNGWFINGGVGQSTYKQGYYNKHDTGYQLNGGYRWAVMPSLLLGVEGGYTDLGKFDPSVQGIGATNTRIHGYTLGGDAHFNLTNNWYLSGRGGYYRWNGKTTSPVAGMPMAFDGHGNGWYGGAGFGYDFNNNMSVGLNYDYYHASKSTASLTSHLVSVSAEYRF